MKCIVAQNHSFLKKKGLKIQNFNQVDSEPPFFLNLNRICAPEMMQFSWKYLHWRDAAERGCYIKPWNICLIQVCFRQSISKRLRNV